MYGQLILLAFFGFLVIVKVMIWLGGNWVNGKPIAENLVRATAAAADRQDGIATVWTSVWKYTVTQGNLIAFKARRAYRYAFTMILNDDAVPTAMPDDTEVRIVVWYPDFDTMKRILWKGTYGTIRLATKHDIDTMIHSTVDVDVQPGEIITIDVLHATSTLDESESSYDLGVTRWVSAT